MHHLLAPSKYTLVYILFSRITPKSCFLLIYSAFFFFCYLVASTKQALLIGNWTYDTHKLEKVRADIKTLHDILDKMEFETIALCNLGKMEILNAADRFCELLLPEYTMQYLSNTDYFC